MCKRRLHARIEVRTPGGAWRRYKATVYLHPRGCMKASQTHLDIHFNTVPEPLRDLLFQRGLTARCTLSQGALLVHLGLVEARLTGLGIDPGRASLSFRCYVSRKRDGGVYLSLPWLS